MRLSTHDRLMRYLRANGFKTYIVTGGGQEFVRAFAGQTYDVPPEQVVGSMGKVKYRYDKEGNPELIKLPEVLLVDDKSGKPEGINMVIGRRPQAAFGNSTGDQEMLEYTGEGDSFRRGAVNRRDKTGSYKCKVYAAEIAPRRQRRKINCRHSAVR